MHEAYYERIAASKSRIELEIEMLAKTHGAHGPDVFRQYVRDTLSVAISEKWARRLCVANGWKG